MSSDQSIRPPEVTSNRTTTNDKRPQQGNTINYTYTDMYFVVPSKQTAIAQPVLSCTAEIRFLGSGTRELLQSRACFSYHRL